MKVFAKVSIKGESRTRKRTPTDVEGKTNPRWNFPFEYTVSESAVQQPGVKLSIRLYCERLRGDKFFGEVDIPIKSLFDKGLKADKILSYQLAGTANGRVNILYSFGRETVLVRKPSGSGWKNMLEVGLFVLMGGAILLLGGGVDEDDDETSDGVPALPASRDVRVVEDEDEDDDVFHDAR